MKSALSILLKKLFLYGVLPFGILCFAVIISFLSYRVYRMHQLAQRTRIDTIQGIAESVVVKIGGVEQWLFIRGHNRKNPIVLFLHGGPGKPETSYMHRFQSELEKQVTVVHWDQRGAGKSFSKEISPESYTIDQYVSDAHEAIGYLKNRFSQNKVFLLGHSWGSVLGLLVAKKHPEEIAGFIGMGQGVDLTEGQKITLAFLKNEAQKRNYQKALDEITALGVPPIPLEKMLTYTKWLMELGGEVYGQSGYGSLIMESFYSPEYSIADHIRWVQGMKSGQVMYPELQRFKLTEHVKEVFVPVYFFLGRHDYNAPSELAADYFNQLKAPKKELVWFESSAHSPNLEEPEKFQQEMIKTVSSLSVSNSQSSIRANKEPTLLSSVAEFPLNAR